MAVKTKKKPAPEPVVEEEDDELEELDEDEETEAPTSKKGAAAQTVTFGAADLAKLASKVAGKEYTAKTIRTLLRKMARDGRITREISPENRSRYDWSGPDDPEVKKILKAIKGGEIEAARKEALDKLKEQSAKKRADKADAKTITKGGKPVKSKKAAPPPDEDEELEEVDELDEDDEE